MSICCSTQLCIHCLILVCALTARDRTHNLGALGRHSDQLSHPARAILLVSLHLFSASHALGAELLLASGAAAWVVLHWGRAAFWAASSRPPKFPVSGGYRQWQTSSLPHKPTSGRLWSDQGSLWLTRASQLKAN